MKQMKILFPLLLISFIALSWSNQTSLSKSQQVIAVHPIELKENVEPQEFEQFINAEIAPICDKIKGLQFMLAKGDRGSRINKYAIILTFSTLEDRNRIYPHGKESPEDWGDAVCSPTTLSRAGENRTLLRFGAAVVGTCSLTAPPSSRNCE